MTQIVVELHHHLIAAINYILSTVVRNAKALHNSFVEARMLQAQHRVAEQLWNTEYRNHSFYAVLDAVKAGDLSRLHK